MNTALPQRPRIANTAQLHHANQESLLSALVTEGVLSVVELSQRFRVPIRTITRLVSRLVDSGLLTTAEPQGRRTVGKPPTLLKVNAAFASIMAVELGAVTTRLAWADFAGRILKSVTVQTGSFLPDLTAGLRREILAFRAACDGSVAAGPLAGLAVGSTGLVDDVAGEVRIGLLPKEVSLRELGQDALRVPVLLENDANLAAEAELWLGAAQGALHATCLLDRGWVGAGLIIHGQLYGGINGRAGELSALAHTPTHRRRGGQIDAPFVASFNLERLVRESGYHACRRPRSGIRSEWVAALGERARAGDSVAAALLQEQVAVFAEALVRLSLLMDPQVLVLAGDFTAAGREWEAALRQQCLGEYRKRVTAAPRFFPQVAFSRVGQDVVVMGGVSAMTRRIMRARIGGAEYLQTHNSGLSVRRL